ncbi:hypothetical protein [Desulfovibrio sp.]
MRAAMSVFVLFLLFGLADAGFAASAWKAKEQACISKCPPFPRFGGIEDQKAWTARLKKQQEYDKCYIGCVKGQMSAWRRPLGPPKDGSQAYFKRNVF